MQGMYVKATPVAGAPKLIVLDGARGPTVSEQRHTSLTAVYTRNEPVYVALQAKGITGQCIADGKVVACVMQFPEKMVAEGVMAAVEFVKSRKMPTGFVNTSVSAVTGIRSQDTTWGLQNCKGLSR